MYNRVVKTERRWECRHGTPIEDKDNAVGTTRHIIRSNNNTTSSTVNTEFSRENKAINSESQN